MIKISERRHVAKMLEHGKSNGYLELDFLITNLEIWRKIKKNKMKYPKSHELSAQAHFTSLPTSKSHRQCRPWPPPLQLHLPSLLLLLTSSAGALSFSFPSPRPFSTPSPLPPPPSLPLPSPTESSWTSPSAPPTSAPTAP